MTSKLARIPLLIFTVVALIFNTIMVYDSFPNRWGQFLVFFPILCLFLFSGWYQIPLIRYKNTNDYTEHYLDYEPKEASKLKFSTYGWIIYLITSLVTVALLVFTVISTLSRYIKTLKSPTTGHFSGNSINEYILLITTPLALLAILMFIDCIVIYKRYISKKKKKAVLEEQG